VSVIDFKVEKSENLDRPNAFYVFYVFDMTLPKT